MIMIINFLMILNKKNSSKKKNHQLKKIKKEKLEIKAVWLKQRKNSKTDLTETMEILNIAHKQQEIVIIGKKKYDQRCIN